jgi:hypothetical protein
MAREPKPTFDPEYIRDLSEKVYCQLLELDCPGNVARMLKKDAEEDPDDGGKKLRSRAAYYDRLTRTYLKVLGIEPVKHCPHASEVPHD